MSKKISSIDKKLYHRVGEVLHYLWDPIGVAEVPEARDEYDAYVSHVFSLLCTSDNEKDSMGMTVTNASQKHTLEIAEILINCKEWIREQGRTNSCSSYG